MKLTLLLALLCSSCSILATTSDILEIRDDIASFKSGDASQAETLANLGLKVSEIGKRDTPLNIQELIGMAIATAGAAGIGVNQFRNMKRKKNDEKY